MSKIYVDIEELENLFIQQGIPYTNILDELKQLSAEDVADRMSVVKLTTVLERKEQVFAMQIWTKNDIVAALKGAEVEDKDIKEELIEEIAAESKSAIENCSSNWEHLHNAVIRVCNKNQISNE